MRSLDLTVVVRPRAGAGGDIPPSAWVNSRALEMTFAVSNGRIFEYLQLGAARLIPAITSPSGPNTGADTPDAPVTRASRISA